MPARQLVLRRLAEDDGLEASARAGFSATEPEKKRMPTPSTSSPTTYTSMTSLASTSLARSSSSSAVICAARLALASTLPRPLSTVSRPRSRPAAR